MTTDDKIERIIQEEQDCLFRLACYKIGDPDDAEDLLQDVFMRTWESLRLRADIDIKRYLYRSVSNACISYHRRHAGIVFTGINDDIADEDDTDDFQEEFRRISRLLKQIPEEQAEVISLHTIGGKNFAEIAELQDLPLSTVKSRFQYGIRKISDMLANNKTEKA